MNRILENAVLDTDIDFQSHNLKNSGDWTPAPAGFVSSSDSRLSDARTPLDGSVSDASIDSSAAIDQSKLNLDGTLPTIWIGTTATTAAQGDLVQFKSEKDAVNGYAGLDGGGKLSSGSLPTTGPQTGTVVLTGLTFPPELFIYYYSPIVSSDTFLGAWTKQPNNSWMGNVSGGSAAPSFHKTAIPISLVPNLDSSQITSGTFDPDTLPVAVGVGVLHSRGAVPDPGLGEEGFAFDYLARDMTYGLFEADIAYQPRVPKVDISFSSFFNDQVNIVISEKLQGVSLFYSVTAPGDVPDGTFTQAPSNRIKLQVDQNSQIQGYAAKAGYNNSGITSYLSNIKPTVSTET